MVGDKQRFLDAFVPWPIHLTFLAKEPLDAKVLRLKRYHRAGGCWQATRYALAAAVLVRSGAYPDMVGKISN